MRLLHWFALISWNIHETVLLQICNNHETEKDWLTMWSKTLMSAGAKMFQAVITHLCGYPD